MKHHMLACRPATKLNSSSPRLHSGQCVAWHHHICLTNNSLELMSDASCAVDQSFVWVTCRSLLLVFCCGTCCQLHCIWRITICALGICWRYIRLRLRHIVTFFVLPLCIDYFSYSLVYLLLMIHCHAVVTQFAAVADRSCDRLDV